MCNKTILTNASVREYHGLLWFMQALGFCNLHTYLRLAKNPEQYGRDFQINLIRAGYSLVRDKRSSKRYP